MVVGCTIFLWAPIAVGQSLSDAMLQSASGMKVQSERMKVVAQNVANATSTGSTPGALPYQRKTITFANRLNRQRGATVVTVDRIGRDTKTDFSKRYEPSHPAADNDGYVLYPNVKRSLEMMDMREAERSYEANLGVMETSRRMYSNTIDLLR